MPIPRVIPSCLCAFVVSCWSGAAIAAPDVEAKDLPRFDAVPPERAIDTFKIRPGFKVELAAAEPVVADPIAACFDEDGRLFVVEMRDYSERRDERLGRIRLLVDADGDGRFERSTVFTQDLPWPTAIFYTRGGILVGAAPDIWYFKDTDGDGVADERRKLFTGFGDEKSRLNVQALLNSFNWGIDNRIHGAASFTPADVQSLAAPGEPRLSLRGRGFSIDPMNWTMRAEQGGGQHGLSFDSFGRHFVCSNSHHIQAQMYDLRYASNNPRYTMPSALVDTAADGPAAEVYRISPEEPWRIIRTRWRVDGQVSGPIEGGGRSAGYFTGATGVTIYTGNAYGREFENDAFIGDAGGNLVHRKKVRPRGAGFVAERPRDEQKSEFLASTDTWFRPVQFINSPDGCLYVLDMYRQVIEHPWSLPEPIKKHLDLNNGNDRGRIYRIVQDGFVRPARPNLSRATAAELAGLLDHPNGWHRQTAARLLCERREAGAAEAVETVLQRAKLPQGRIHALYVLRSLGALQPRQIITACGDSHPAVRRHAIRLCEDFLREGTLPDELWRAIAPFAEDADAAVRHQLALTLGLVKHGEKATILAKLARRAGNDSWINSAILAAMDKGAGTFVDALLLDAKFVAGDGRMLAEGAMRLAGADDDAGALLEKLAGTSDPALRFALAAALAEGASQSGRASGSLGTPADRLLEQAAAVAANATAEQAQRLAAIRLLAFGRFNAVNATLESLLAPKHAPAIQVAAVDALDRFDEPGLATLLAAKAPDLSPEARTRLIDALIRRAGRITPLLDAIEKKTITPAQLSASQLRRLRTYDDAAIRKRAVQLLGAPPAARRQEVVDRYQPTLQLKGDAMAGREIYRQRCATCHRAGEEGHALGPDLKTVANTGRDKLLVSILDPNREVAGNAIAHLIETREGEGLTGLLADETATAVTLKQANGLQRTIPRTEIKKLRSLNESLMPEGLEENLSTRQLADLLEFIEKL